MGPPYKDVMGRYRTLSLFRESYLDGEEPIFSLQEEDFVDSEGKVFPSFRRLFLSYNDPTGYQFAKEVLGSYEHWKKLCRAGWFKAHLETWLEELDVKLMSVGVRKLREIADGDSGQAANAAKFLVDKGWMPKKGRPTKAAIEQAAKQQAGVDAAVNEDYERLRVVK